MPTTNRNKIKQFFITFPKSTCDKHTFRDHLLRFNPEYYKVSEEKHKDGSPHLHAVLKTKSPYSKAFVLKKFKEIYPHDYKRIDVEGCRSINHARAYISKEDTSPLESGDFKDSRDPKLARLTKFAAQLGWGSLADVERDVKTLDENCVRLHNFTVSLWQHAREQCSQYGCSPEGYINLEIELSDYETYKAILRFLQNQILIDDITLLSNHYGITE